MEAREGFYQTQLKTLERYGGIQVWTPSIVTTSFEVRWNLVFSLFIL